MHVPTGLAEHLDASADRVCESYGTAGSWGCISIEMQAYLRNARTKWFAYHRVCEMQVKDARGDMFLHRTLVMSC